MLRILVADDYEIVRAGVCAIIATRPDWQVVAEAADGLEAVAMAAQVNPHVAILDDYMPLLSGGQAALQMRDRFPSTRSIVMGMHNGAANLQILLQAGVRGYVLKSDPGSCLVDAISTVARGNAYFTPNISAALLEFVLANPTHPVLTPRQQHIVQLIAEGYTNKQIARLLEVSLKTVESHRASIMRRLHCRTTAHVVRYAIRNLLVEP